MFYLRAYKQHFKHTLTQNISRPFIYFRYYSVMLLLHVKSKSLIIFHPKTVRFLISIWAWHKEYTWNIRTVKFHMWWFKTRSCYSIFFLITLKGVHSYSNQCNSILCFFLLIHRVKIQPSNMLICSKIKRSFRVFTIVDINLVISQLKCTRALLASWRMSCIPCNKHKITKVRSFQNLELWISSLTIYS